MLPKYQTSLLVKKTRFGFTLLEIMAVVVIMGLLVGAAAVSVRGYIRNAKQMRVKQDLTKLSELVDSYWMATGRYPTTEEGLDVLTKQSGAYHASIRTLSKDPWNHPYQYFLIEDEDQDSDPYQIVCLGSDGMEGGTGTAADIDHVQAREGVLDGQ